MPFPSNAQFVPLTQNNLPVVDPVSDVSPDETDIVGNAQFPAAYYAYDGTNVYFRMRLNADPRFKTNFHNFAWGVLFDTDNNPATYEWELVVNGLENEVQLIVNTVKLPNIMTDQAEGTDGKGNPNYSETICNFDIARAQPTEDGSQLGSSPNYFLDFFVPANTLFTLLGITDQSSLRFLFFTATNNNNFNKDFIGIGQTLSTLFCDPVTIAGGDVRAELSVTQSVASSSTPVIAGQTSSFTGTISVTNTGRSQASTLFLQAPFLFDKTISLTVTQKSQGTTAFNSTTKNLTWNIGNLAVGATTTLTYQALGQFNTAGSRTVDTKTITGVDSFTGEAVSAPASSATVSVVAIGGVTGTIIDKSTGLPISGITVQATTVIGGTNAGQTTSNGGGVYGFPQLPVGSYNLTFSLNGYQSTTATTTVVAGIIQTVNVTLTPIPAVIQGTVTASGSGSPISGAIVHVTDSIGVLAAQTVTNAAGAYVVNGLTPGYYRVSLAADQFQARDFPVTLAIAETRILNAVLLPNPGTVTGTITNAQTGAPLAGVLVEVLDNRNSILSSTLTNAAGSYIIASLSPATNDRLRISADTFVAQVIGFSISAGQTKVVNAALSPVAGNLTGIITDEITGLPLAGASIRVFTAEGITLQTTSTAVDGSYTIPSLAPGSYSIVIAEEGYAGQTIGAMINAASTTTLNVSLQQLAGAITGSVTDSTTGAPVADSIIRVFLNNIIVVRVASLEDGTYDIGNLAPGNYFVTIRADGYGGQSFSVTVNPGETTTENFILFPNPGSLTGVVTDASGNPIVGAVISLNVNVAGGGLLLTRFVTQTDGSYIIENLLPLQYLVTAAAVPYQTTFQSVAVAADTRSTLNFVLSPNPGTISGTVVDTNGTPVAGAGVVIKMQSGNGVSIASIFTDTNGHFQVSSLTPSFYTVLATANNFQTASATVSVVADATSPISLVLLPDPGSIEGQIVDAATGGVILGVAVTVTDSNNFLIASLIADTKSGFQFDGLPPGSYTVAVHALNYKGEVLGAIVQSNSITPVNFALEPNPGTLVGEVTPAIGGALIQLFNNNNILISSVFTQPDGKFTFIGEKVGSYYVTAIAMGYSSQVAGATILAGQTTNVTLTLSPNPGQILGKVVDPAGIPIATAVVKVLNSNESIRGIGPAQGDGSYVIDAIPAGPKTIIASAPNFSNSVKGAFVDPGKTVTDVNFVLTPDPGTISGQITDQVTGLIIPGASIEIRLNEATGLSVASATTTPFGNYQISGLQPGSYTVIAKANNFATGTVGTAVQSNGSSIANLALNPLFGAINGIVTDTVGNPIGANDTRIKLYTKDGTLLETVFVEMDGSFHISGVPSGEYIISVSAPFFETETVGITIRAGSTTNVQLQLSPQTATILGTVKNSLTSAPVSGSLIIITDVEGLPVDTAYTDETGSFVITGIPAGNFAISAIASGFGTGIAAVVTRSGQNSVAGLFLTPLPGQVVGFVSDLTNGANIAGAEIRIMDASSGATIGTVLSDNGGQYTFPSLAPGSYKAIVTVGGYASEFGGFAIVAGETTRFSFALQPLPGRLIGSVSNKATGAPLSGVTIQLLQYNNFGPALSTLLTDNNGLFDLGEVAATNYALTASLQGFITQQSSTLVNRGETTIVTFALIQIKTGVGGTVTSGPGRQPLPNTSVTIVDSNGVVGGNGITDGNGEYLVPSIPAGEQTIVVSKAAAGTNTTVIPESLGQTQNANVTVTAAAQSFPITGTVTSSFNAAPIPGSVVHVLDASTKVSLLTAVTDLNGAYTTDPVAPGTYTVTGSAPSYGSAARSIATNAAFASRADLTLSAAFGTLRGTIRDTSGNPLDMALAEIVTTNRELIRQIISNSSGQYAFTNIAAGVPTAEFSFPGKQTAIRMPTITDGQTTILDVVLLDDEEE
ncbi:carboxypeptidase regulatory-like domain-containing protein [Paenibacillus glycanilyticus]|uniref:carboxypeptidase regulatory-like domain-containing protein n=1 Tax=Paenibacillus glycanilyticus TaxID=126569 RepID=UPI00203DF30D|nr:carboxypeptidase regulatory-like domain-containing protein [Paenibacillus glycanilyticus]MCM3630196.1 carboxypeptidase regulatory-like domain-containing protein [Paenibacillus glycanilyticus]